MIADEREHRVEKVDALQHVDPDHGVPLHP
jgi:hypothetical protein